MGGYLNKVVKQMPPENGGFFIGWYLDTTFNSYALNGRISALF